LVGSTEKLAFLPCYLGQEIVKGLSVFWVKQNGTDIQILQNKAAVLLSQRQAVTQWVNQIINGKSKIYAA